MKKNKRKLIFTRVIVLIFAVVLMFCLLFSNKSNAAQNHKNLKVLDAISVVVMPVQKVLYTATNGVGSWLKNNFHSGELLKKNNELQAEINDLRRKLVDFNKYKIQNQEFSKLLDLKNSEDDSSNKYFNNKFGYELNDELKILSALVVGQISATPYKSFIIDKGSRDGVGVHNAVVTADGIVGCVYKVFPKSAVVQTILDSQMSIGVYNTNNAESGMLTGSLELAYNNLTKMKYLSRQTDAKPGDVLITSGTSNNIPKGILVGKIVSLKQEEDSTSVFGIIEPFVDFEDVKHVFVVESFLKLGQSLDK